MLVHDMTRGHDNFVHTRCGIIASSALESIWLHAGPLCCRRGHKHCRWPSLKRKFKSRVQGLPVRLITYCTSAWLRKSDPYVAVWRPTAKHNVPQSPPQQQAATVRQLLCRLASSASMLQAWTATNVCCPGSRRWVQCPWRRCAAKLSAAPACLRSAPMATGQCPHSTCTLLSL
jgi:hypothetical protein